MKTNNLQDYILKNNIAYIYEQITYFNTVIIREYGEKAGKLHNHRMKNNHVLREYIGIEHWTKMG